METFLSVSWGWRAGYRPERKSSIMASGCSKYVHVCSFTFRPFVLESYQIFLQPLAQHPTLFSYLYRWPLNYVEKYVKRLHGHYSSITKFTDVCIPSRDLENRDPAYCNGRVAFASSPWSIICHDIRVGTSRTFFDANRARIGRWFHLTEEYLIVLLFSP